MSRTNAELLASATLRGLALDPLGLRVRYVPQYPNPGGYAEALTQLDVEHSARYERDVNGTYCNIFLWDGTVACRCEIPHWVWPDAAPATPYATRKDSKDVTELAHELSANETARWLRANGARYGWRPADRGAAQTAADSGTPTVFAWENPTGGHGHVGFVRPSGSDRQMRFAQAGAVNSSNVSASHVFTSVEPDFYVFSS